MADVDEDDDRALLLQNHSQNDQTHANPQQTPSLPSRVLHLVITFRVYLTTVLLSFCSIAILLSILPTSREIMRFATHPSLWSTEGLLRLTQTTMVHLHDSVWFYIVFAGLYIFMQTFSVPGSIVLNTFAGMSMGVHVGFAMCCIFNTLGACCCYFLSLHSWGKVVHSLFGPRIEAFNHEINHHRHNLLIYCTLLRVFPLCPCWFINMASAFVDIPFRVFAFSVFFGLMPYNWLTVSAGHMLGTLGVMNTNEIRMALLRLSCIVFVLALPVIFRRRIARVFAAENMLRPQPKIRHVDLELEAA